LFADLQRGQRRLAVVRACPALFVTALARPLQILVSLEQHIEQLKSINSQHVAVSPSSDDSLPFQIIRQNDVTFIGPLQSVLKLLGFSGWSAPRVADRLPAGAVVSAPLAAASSQQQQQQLQRQNNFISVAGLAELVLTAGHCAQLFAAVERFGGVCFVRSFIDFLHNPQQPPKHPLLAAIERATVAQPPCLQSVPFIYESEVFDLFGVKDYAQPTRLFDSVVSADELCASFSTAAKSADLSMSTPQPTAAMFAARALLLRGIIEIKPGALLPANCKLSKNRRVVLGLEAARQAFVHLLSLPRSIPLPADASHWPITKAVVAAVETLFSAVSVEQAKPTERRGWTIALLESAATALSQLSEREATDPAMTPALQRLAHSLGAIAQPRNAAAANLVIADTRADLLDPSTFNTQQYLRNYAEPVSLSFMEAAMGHSQVWCCPIGL
jgi:hypothetical protein